MSLNFLLFLISILLNQYYMYLTAATKSNFLSICFNFCKVPCIRMSHSNTLSYNTVVAHLYFIDIRLHCFLFSSRSDRIENIHRVHRSLSSGGSAANEFCPANCIGSMFFPITITNNHLAAPLAYLPSQIQNSK